MFPTYLLRFASQSVHLNYPSSGRCLFVCLLFVLLQLKALSSLSMAKMQLSNPLALSTALDPVTAIYLMLPSPADTWA